MQIAQPKFAGLRIGRLRRNSTPRQQDNYSAQNQEKGLDEYLVREGATVVPYDEQATSGRDLAKRERARSLLEEIRGKKLDGIAVSVLDRLTRDEHGTDAGIFAEALIEARAVLVTFDRVYRLWEREDLRLYRLLTGISGVEVIDIRDRMWTGLLTKAQSEPFFMGVPPFGYATQIVEKVRARGARRARDMRRPVKDETVAPTMRRLARALDACSTLGEVVDTMKKAGETRAILKGPESASRSSWHAQHLRVMLANTLYEGVWTLGRRSDRTSTVWELSRSRGFGSPGQITLDVPELAWYTPDQMARWRSKYVAAVDQPRGRHRTHTYLLRGVFRCIACGRVMIGAGHGHYACPSLKGNLAPGSCPAGQLLSEKAALRILAGMLPEALGQCADYETALRARANASTVLDDLLSRVAMREAQIASLVARWYPDDKVLNVPDAIVAKLEGWKGERDKWAREAADLSGNLAGATERREMVEALLADPRHGLDGEDAHQRAEVFRLVFRDVKVKATGWAGGRRYEVQPGWCNLLLEQVPGQSASTRLRHLSTIVRLVPA